jgi:cysteine desulfuration protein SufE
MQTMSPIEQELVEEFSLFEDWMDKYDHIISLGNELKPMDPTWKTDVFLIHGCQSRVWVKAFDEGGLLRIQADADALIAKGVVAMLVRVYSGQPAAWVAKAASHPEFIDKIGLREHLSPTRSNGLTAMLKRIQQEAQRIAS